MTRACLPFVLMTLALAAAATAATGVPCLQDPPATPVPRIEDPPRTHVPRLTDADDDLLPVKSRQWPPAAPVPAAPAAADSANKAGKGASPPITGSFSYDLMLGFIGQVPGEPLITSYFFLDSRHGHIGMDRGAIETLGNASAAGEGAGFDFQVFTNAADHYLYLQSSDLGPVAIKAASGQDVLGADLEVYFQATTFEDSFRKTGRVRHIGADLSGKPYASEEFTGTNPETGAPVSLWLAKPDFAVGFYAASYFGLGVVPLPKARQQRLVTRMEGEGVVFELSYVMRKSKRFSGAGYRDMSTMLPGAMP